jgi:L-ascorbate metabolism protein UlaG (beta-lactamase superfamily)
MDIIWLGHSCFRLKSREGSIVVDPYHEDLGLTLGKMSADVVLVTHDHAGHNNAKAVSGFRKIVSGPGEYEVRDIMINGIRTYHDNQKGELRGKNTTYLIRIDGVAVCHLGDLGHILSSSQVNEMDEVDVLLVPVGGESTIGAGEASEIIGLIDPRIVIPMHYQFDGIRSDLDTLDRFLREMGAAGAQSVARLVVSHSNLPEDTQIIPLERRRQ